MALSGHVGAVYVSDIDAAPISFTDAATTRDTARKRYQVTDPKHRYWSPDEPVTVKKNGAVITSGFTLERAGGFVVFDEALTADDEITVSGEALTIVQAGGFFNWNVDTDSEDADATTFESQGFKEFEQVLKGWNGSAEAFWGDEKFFNMLGEIVVVKLFTDAGASQKCVEGFAIINGDGIESAVDQLVQESIDFTGVGALYIRL
jgi:hypothetical protein